MGMSNLFIASLSDVFGIEPKHLFEFSSLDSPAKVRNELLALINGLDDEQIILTYKYVKTFVL